MSFDIKKKCLSNKSVQDDSQRQQKTLADLSNNFRKEKKKKKVFSFDLLRAESVNLKGDSRIIYFCKGAPVRNEKENCAK